MTKLKIAVLISGSGTNLQSLIDACQNKDFPAKIVLVLSNKAGAFGLKRAKDANIPTCIIDHKNFESREEFDESIHAQLLSSDVELVCLAGFMRILTAGFVKKWQNNMVNIHPSLLPSYKGLDTHKRVLRDGVKLTGCTVHYVRPEMDEGPIIIQAAVPVSAADTPETLREKVLIQEHIIYPEAVRLIASRSLKIHGNKISFFNDIKNNETLTNPLVMKN